MPDTRAELDTRAFLSTMACFRYLPIRRVRCISCTRISCLLLAVCLWRTDSGGETTVAAWLACVVLSFAGLTPRRVQLCCCVLGSTQQFRGRFSHLSMAPSMVASMMRDSTRMELARYRSSAEFMSFVRLDVTAQRQITVVGCRCRWCCRWRDG